jgi:hypothetical protein
MVRPRLPEDTQSLSFDELLGIARQLEEEVVKLEVKNKEQNRELNKLLKRWQRQGKGKAASGPAGSEGIRTDKPSKRQATGSGGQATLPASDRLIAKLARKSMSAIRKTRHTPAKKPYIYTVRLQRCIDYGWLCFDRARRGWTVGAAR